MDLGHLPHLTGVSSKSICGLEMLGSGLLTRLGAYAVFALGFWLLFQGFDRPSPALGVLGGAGVLLGMYLMVGQRPCP